MAFVIFKRWSWLNLLIEILFALILIFCIYISYSIFIKKDYITDKSIFPMPVSSVKKTKPLVRREPKDYSQFLERIEKSEIFKSPNYHEPTPRLKVARKDLSKITANLKLVGIVSGVSPRAAIEDRRGRKSFYLREGEEFLEGIKVVEIKRGMVILNYDGERFELSL